MVNMSKRGDERDYVGNESVAILRTGFGFSFRLFPRSKREIDSQSASHEFNPIGTVSDGIHRAFSTCHKGKSSWFSNGIPRNKHIQDLTKLTEHLPQFFWSCLEGEIANEKLVLVVTFFVYLIIGDRDEIRVVSNWAS